MKISQVLGVDVEELLSGVVKRGKRGRIAEYRIVTVQSPEGMLLEQFDRLDNSGKQRLMGYLEAMVGRGKLLERKSIVLKQNTPDRVRKNKK